MTAAIRLSIVLRVSSRLIRTTRSGRGTCSPKSALPLVWARASAIESELLPVPPMAAVPDTSSRSRCRPYRNCQRGISASQRNRWGSTMMLPSAGSALAIRASSSVLRMPVLEPPAHVLALRNVGVAHDLERHEISELGGQQGAPLGAFEAVGLAVVVLVDRRITGAENPQPGGELGGPAQSAAGIGGGHEAELGHGVGVALALANLHLDVGVGPQRRGQFRQPIRAPCARRRSLSPGRPNPCRSNDVGRTGAPHLPGRGGPPADGENGPQTGRTSVR